LQQGGLRSANLFLPLKSLSPILTTMNKHIVERISAAEAAEHLPELLAHVASDGVTYEITQHEAVVARVVPAVKSVTLGELDRLFAQLPLLGTEEAALWEAELDALRRDMKAPESPWE
jgi:antitoxin (DNA-binding transcriptional repressor) of toxin-antitoxin stability system